MADRSSSLEGDGENLLQSALAMAFTPAPTFRQPQPSQHPPPPAQSAEPTNSTPVDADPSASSASTDDSWKSEYEAQVQSWRAQSAEAREKAEKERARWEDIRAREKTEGGSGEPKIGEVEREAAEPDPSPVDARGLVSGEHEAKPSAHTHQGTGDESKASSQKWSDVPSDLASSYPSLSFPSPSRPASPTHSHSHRTHPQPATHHAHHTNPQVTHASQSAAPVPTSATLAVFDSELSIQTRLGALISSLGINLLLPFVNGVMLGFGEIFAKNVVVGWLGWQLPGSGVANVGLRSGAAGRR